MKKQFFIAAVLSLGVLLALPVTGQENEDALPVPGDVEATPAAEEIPPAQEVEINEDNYRQFMELKDPNLQREVIPENVFKPGSGLQKLEKLPEESQKHLRNELREIIVQGDPWQPGDEQGEFPYTPSAAAANNPSLEKQEREAWGELVDSYNQREAQIYENAAGSRAARASEDGSGENFGKGANSAAGTGQDNEGSPGQQADQAGNSESPDTAGTYSPGASSDPNATSTAGVSQNAMEFLRGLGKGGSGEAEATEKSDPGSAATASMAAGGTQAGEQDNPAQETADTGGSPGSARQPSETSTAGASQNAMEFLKGNSAQGKAGRGAETSQANQGQGDPQAGEQGQAQADGQQNGQEAAQAEDQGDAQASNQDDGEAQDEQQTETEQTPALSLPPASTTPLSPAETEEESTAGASQNALEYLTGEQAQASDGKREETAAGEPEGTLTIQELLNAQGVGASIGTAPAPADPAGQEQADEGKPDKDGGSR